MNPPASSPGVAAARMEAWKLRLLDLTLRNRLLNFRPGRRAVFLLGSEAGLEQALEEGREPPATTGWGILPGLEDALAGDKTFLVHTEEELAGRRRRAGKGQEPPAREDDGLAALLEAERGRGRLYAPLGPEELERRLLLIQREARVNLEEGGANTLYLALGFLRWAAADEPDKPLLAPLLLLPLTMRRASARAPFEFSLPEDEPRLNITLLRKLEVDCGLSLLGEWRRQLPQDEAGVDLPRLFSAFQAGLPPEWRLLPAAAVANVSFSRFLLWEDLEARGAEFAGHPLVARLCGAAAGADEALRAGGEPPADLPCPLDADASQLAAASAGGDFVLEGPPGTGKSQTIANIIARQMAAGRSVLFVAEKMAALEVVLSRLGGVGLRPFCLELHSDKIGKNEAYARIQEAVDERRAAAEFLAGREERERAWREGAARRDALARELDDLARALGARRPCGLSFQEIVTRLAGLRGAPEVRGLFAAPPAAEAVRGQAELLERFAESEGRPRPAAIWADAGLRELPPATETRVAGELAALEAEQAALAAGLDPLRAALGLPAGPPPEPLLRLLGELAGLWAGRPGATLPGAGLAGAGDFAARLELAGRAVDLAARARAAREAALARVRPAALAQLDVPGLLGLVAAAERASFLTRWYRAGRARAAVAWALRAPGRPTLRDLRVLAGEVLAARETLAALGSVAPAEREALGPLWRDADTDAEAARALLGWTATFRRLAGRLRAASGADAAACARWCGLAAATPEEHGLAAGELAALGGRAAACEARRRGLAALLEEDPEAARPPEAAAAFTRSRRLDLAGLRRQAERNRLRRELTDAGLEPLLAARDGGAVGPDQLAAALDKAALAAWKEEALAAEPVLRAFSPALHERRRAEFAALDRRLLEEARAVLRGRLLTRAPDAAAGVAPASSFGRLLRELQKKTRRAPLRALLAEHGALLAGGLKPCFLMSPLSVARFLGPGFPRFDLVIFDEASQIPMEEAVGAIARGSRTVVAGDPLQLPPTAFFRTLRSASGEEEPEPPEGAAEEARPPGEVESLLKEMQVALPTRRLLWHYRSRSESLISFSNANFYRGELVTFPSAPAPRRGLSFHPVTEGSYDRGGTRTHRAEAGALVAALVERARAGGPPRSYGVVTMSLPQQQLLEDLLEQARKDCPELEALAAGPAGRRPAEPLFVKNLESVQGDERDVILLSVAYGADAKGRVWTNFGPLNQDGGDRRLNVAVTRAREEMVVFSSLAPDQLPKDALRARGALLLRDFLEHARRAGEGRLEAPRPAVLADPLLAEVRAACAAEFPGAAVRLDAGLSRCRLAVVAAASGRHPAWDVDDADWAAMVPARDRERLRPEILSAMGWDLRRVWRQDWLEHGPR